MHDAGILGGKGLRILPVFDNQPLAKSGDTLKTNSQPSLAELAEEKFTPFLQKFESAVSDADSVLVNVNQVLDEKTKGI